IKPDSPIGRPLAEILDASAGKASHPNKHFFQEDGPARIPVADLASATCVIRNTMKNQERVREVLQWAGGHPPSGVKEEFVSFWRSNVPVRAIADYCEEPVPCARCELIECASGRQRRGGNSRPYCARGLVENENTNIVRRVLEKAPNPALDGTVHEIRMAKGSRRNSGTD